MASHPTKTDNLCRSDHTLITLLNDELNTLSHLNEIIEQENSLLKKNTACVNNEYPALIAQKQQLLTALTEHETQREKWLKHNEDKKYASRKQSWENTLAKYSDALPLWKKIKTQAKTCQTNTLVCARMASHRKHRAVRITQMLFGAQNNDQTYNALGQTLSSRGGQTLINV
ncbi:flagella synthesis protein FlgN [Marinibactrum halimedae]|uniref:Flagellar protein FlgN n=1 Tax=Marinibactrum halimedae TaxID=1444977 RepID=A0AA37T5Y7_9GAMM|nr:flagellar export chaperone FlgN [Marinibactrum halimedae]MCD9461121.1 flagellar protein FlgN [Marinibactrum halimedae]GLS24461.1 hypothetical protein GCM10007877_01720 [Marinibactrum halimedae]